MELVDQICWIQNFYFGLPASRCGDCEQDRCPTCRHSLRPVQQYFVTKESQFYPTVPNLSVGFSKLELMREGKENFFVYYASLAWVSDTIPSEKSNPNSIFQDTKQWDLHQSSFACSPWYWWWRRAKRTAEKRLLRRAERTKWWLWRTNTSPKTTCPKITSPKKCLCSHEFSMLCFFYGKC